jgi:predicted transcriptional regulator
MTITINLPPATLDELKAEAQATGKDVETVVREAVESKLARRRRTFAEIMKPLHDDVEARGLSDDQVGDIMDKELKAARGEKRSRKAQS